MATRAPVDVPRSIRDREVVTEATLERIAYAVGGEIRLDVAERVRAGAAVLADSEAA